MGLIRRKLRGFFRPDIFRRMLPYLRPHKLSAVVVFTILLAQTGLALIDPWPMQVIIDNGLSGKNLSHWLTTLFPFANGASRKEIIVYAVAGGLVLRLIGSALGIGGDYLKGRVNDSMILRHRLDMLRHMQRLSFSYHDQTTVGDSLYRLGSDASWVAPLTWGFARHLFTSTLTLIGMLFIVAKLDWQIAVLACASAPITYAAVAIASRYFNPRWHGIRRLESSTGAILNELLSCLRVVKAFGTEEREQKRYADSAWKLTRTNWRIGVEQGLFWTGIDWVGRIMSRVILLFAAFHVLQGKLTIGELTVILAYTGQIQAPLDDIGHMLADMQYAFVGGDRSLQVFDTEVEVQNRPDAKSLERARGAVSFENVGFSYHDGPRVLDGITFAASPGEVVAIVGPTGAGKTTLSSLLVRFYDPQSGSITLDGHDLRDLSIKTLRDNTSVVLQEPVLFSGPIRDNIAYARPDASMEEIEAAARDANAHDFISALPEGYDSLVGERGTRLSGGERQRLAVARAFLKDAPVLILDEPTSSIDSRTELVIVEALQRLMVGRTTFIIAHRLSTILDADQILVMDKGRIVERGTHDELADGNGLYAQLYRVQSGRLRGRQRRAQKRASAERTNGGAGEQAAEEVLD